MKRCPQCGRDYNDDSMSLCLDDGSELLFGPSNRSEPLASGAGFPSDEPQTAILHETARPGEAATRAQIHTTEQTAVFPSGVSDAPKTRRLDKRLLLAPLALAVIVLGGFFAYRYITISNSGQIESIAVLPFENRSESADAEYLSDGLAESLIYRLSQLPDLKVSPTSSVMQYKGKGGSLATVAKELDVRAVMTGKLVQRGDNLTISIELIDVANNKLLWGEQYERKMSELLTTQREIAATIGQKLQLKLSGEETGLTKKYTNDNEAYQLYLKGRYYWGKRDDENIRKAIEQFKAAVSKDPRFARAYVGLADSYAILPYYTSIASTEVLPEAKTYATRAIEIDGSEGEAHASLGFINFQSWNWADAEKNFRQAIELNPNYGTGRKWYGQLLHSLGRLDEAEIEYKRAVELEPLSIIAYNNLAELYVRKGDLNAAAEQFTRALELDPNWYFARMNWAQVLSKQGRNAEAIAEAERSVELSKRENIPLGILGYVYAKAGRQTDAVKVLDELKERYQKQQSSGLDIARVYAALGEKDQAFAWLEKEFQSRNQKMPIWFGIGIFEPLRDDPRYKDLLIRMNLPE